MKSKLVLFVLVLSVLVVGSFAYQRYRESDRRASNGRGSSNYSADSNSNEELCEKTYSKSKINDFTGYTYTYAADTANASAELACYFITNDGHGSRVIFFNTKEDTDKNEFMSAQSIARSAVAAPEFGDLAFLDTQEAAQVDGTPYTDMSLYVHKNGKIYAAGSSVYGSEQKTKAFLGEIIEAMINEAP